MKQTIQIFGRVKPTKKTTAVSGKEKLNTQQNKMWIWLIGGLTMLPNITVKVSGRA